jgi:hypothetical protein
LHGRRLRPPLRGIAMISLKVITITVGFSLPQGTTKWLRILGLNRSVKGCDCASDHNTPDAADGIPREIIIEETAAFSLGL